MIDAYLSLTAWLKEKFNDSEKLSLIYHPHGIILLEKQSFKEPKTVWKLAGENPGSTFCSIL